MVSSVHYRSYSVSILGVYGAHTAQHGMSCRRDKYRYSGQWIRKPVPESDTQRKVEQVNRFDFLPFDKTSDSAKQTMQFVLASDSARIKEEFHSHLPQKLQASDRVTVKTPSGVLHRKRTGRERQAPR